MKQSRNIGFFEDTKQFHHGARADYCVYSDGRVTRTWKKSMTEELVSVYLSKGKAMVKCGGKDYILKHVVATSFLPEYRKGASVVCVDGNEWNCNVDNLCVMSNRQLGRLTGYKSKSQAVQVTDLRTGTTQTYRSIREAAKSLHCSYQTVLDFMNGKSKNSCLQGYEVKKAK